jgi:hypothetical protein
MRFSQCLVGLGFKKSFPCETAYNFSVSFRYVSTSAQSFSVVVASFAGHWLQHLSNSPVKRELRKCWAFKPLTIASRSAELTFPIGSDQQHKQTLPSALISKKDQGSRQSLLMVEMVKFTVKGRLSLIRCH